MHANKLPQPQTCEEIKQKNNASFIRQTAFSVVAEATMGEREERRTSVSARVPAGFHWHSCNKHLFFWKSHISRFSFRDFFL